jgi:hypothetical protein
MVHTRLNVDADNATVLKTNSISVLFYQVTDNVGNWFLVIDRNYKWGNRTTCGNK